MMGQMGSFDRPSAGLGDVLDLYLHRYLTFFTFTISFYSYYPSARIFPQTNHPIKSYVSSRIINLVRASEPEGLPITIAATHLDGLVLALTPNSRKYAPSFFFYSLPSPLS
jgi:hypothetical protein